MDSFQDTILAQQQLTNLGIMKSPGTGSMILSMYYPIYEGQRCIGYVGAGVYASHLMDALLNLDIRGLPDSEYVFLNAEGGIYLYHEDDALLNTETTDIGYLEIIQRIKTSGDTQADTYSYRDENGNKESLQSIHANLVTVIRDISQVASQVDTSADNVSTGAQALSQGTIEQAASIDGLLHNVTDITSQIQTSAARCSSASELVDKATGYATRQRPTQRWNS